MTGRPIHWHQDYSTCRGCGRYVLTADHVCNERRAAEHQLALDVEGGQAGGNNLSEPPPTTSTEPVPGGTDR